MDLLADFLHFGTSVFLLHVGLEQCEVWGVKSAVWSVKCEGSSGKWEVWSVECEVWSVKFKFGVRRAQCEVWSVKCEVWSVKEAVRSEKCGVWSVKCGVWSLKFGVRRVQCAVWGVECRGKDTVGTGCLWTIGHLCLGNFRRRLARVYVTGRGCWDLLETYLRLAWDLLVTVTCGIPQLHEFCFPSYLRHTCDLVHYLWIQFDLWHTWHTCELLKNCF